MGTAPVWLHRAPSSPRFERSTWGTRAWLKLAQSWQYDSGVNGKRHNSKDVEKKLPTEAAAKALVKKWIAEKLADGWIDQHKYKAPGAKTESKPWPKGKAKPPSWLTKVATPELDRIRKAIAKAKLQHRAADIESLLRPAIRFDLVPATTRDGVATRFGGDPDVPTNFAWPVHGKTPLAFVAQYRLDELTHMDLENRLPRSGLLSVFVYLVPDGDDYCERVSVFLFKDLQFESQKQRLSPPHTASADGRPGKQARGRPRLILTLPSTDDREFGSLKLTDDERDRYHDKLWLTIRDAPSSPAKPGAHTLLGYDRKLLAQIDSDRRFDLELGDVETLGLYMDARKLAARDFRRVRASMQTG